jgi:hypothetical protein
VPGAWQRTYYRGRRRGEQGNPGKRRQLEWTCGLCRPDESGNAYADFIDSFQIMQSPRPSEKYQQQISRLRGSIER